MTIDYVYIYIYTLTTYVLESHGFYHPHLVGGFFPPRPEKYESIGMIRNIPNINGKIKN